MAKRVKFIKYPLEAYVDGCCRRGKTGWGVVIVKSNEVLDNDCGILTDEEVQGTRQVAGELRATVEAINWCKEHKVDCITIYYDFHGVRRWANNSWSANISLTQEYKEFMKNCGIKICWVKLKGHSGNKFHDMADELSGLMIE